MTTIDYNVGDTIEYVTFTGSPRQVVVTLREADIKGGHPGFDGHAPGRENDEGARFWGYDDQITRVVRRAGR